MKRLCTVSLKDGMALLFTSLVSLAIVPLRATAAPVVLPVEVIGEDGYTAVVRFSLDDATGINYLYLQVHRPAYRDALINPEPGAKASVQLNDGEWIDLTNETVEVYQPAAAYGGLGGGFHTVKMKVPITTAQPAENTLRFRFNGTDGLTSGYRVLALNLLRGDTPVLPESSFVADDPGGWTAPLDNPTDVAAGRELWENRALRESPLAENTIRATCGDCHARNGSDLKYFNYSNWAIEERSKFHGLSDTEAQQIASYIRSLEVAAPAQARPWNPPYQPGPGLDSKPVTEWAAGAGLDGVLEKDADMLPYLFPEGTSETAIAKVADTDVTLNLRELPVAVQFPDWNEWLPEHHPKDVFPTTFEAGPANLAYQELRTELAANRDALISSKRLPGTLSSLKKGIVTYITEGQTAGRWQWRATKSPVLDARDPDFSLGRAKENLAKWAAVKNWEVITGFDLQDVAPQIYERGEARAWPTGLTNSVFDLAPHIVASNLNNFKDQDALLGDYRSSVWYQLQMTLNAGQKIPTGEQPMDWPYQQRHVNELAERSGVWDGLRYTVSNIKAYQERDNGTGPARRGWELRVTHPWWLYSNPNVNTRLMESLDQAAGGLKNRVVNSMLREFLEIVNSPGFEPENWTRCGHGGGVSSVTRWYCVEPEDYVPVAYRGSGRIFFFPQNYHADNFYRVVPRLQESGVDPQVINDLIDWCKTMWPRGNWDQYRPEMSLTTLVADKLRTKTTTSELRLFPNPVAHERLRVSTSEASTLQHVVLLDASGRKLLQQPTRGQAQLSLDVSQLPPGLYVVKAYGPQQTLVEKIIIE